MFEAAPLNRVFFLFYAESLACKLGLLVLDLMNQMVFLISSLICLIAQSSDETQLCS